MQRLPWRQLLYEAEQAGKKAALSPNVSIDSQAPLRTRGLSERKWRSVDVLQYGSFSLSGVPPQRMAKRNWLAMTWNITPTPHTHPPLPILPDHAVVLGMTLIQIYCSKTDFVSYFAKGWNNDMVIFYILFCSVVFIVDYKVTSRITGRIKKDVIFSISCILLC